MAVSVPRIIREVNWMKEKKKVEPNYMEHPELIGDLKKLLAVLVVAVVITALCVILK